MTRSLGREHMLSTRGWDITVVVASVVMAVATATLFAPASLVRLLIALAALAAFTVGYVVVARAGLEPPRARWRYPAFLAVATLTVAVAVGSVPFMAILQLLAYPIAWLVGDTRARGIGAAAVIAAGVFVGAWIGYGPSVDSALAGTVTAAFGFAVSVVIGLWIVRVDEYGREKARLVAELTAAQSEIAALSRERGASAERERLARDIHDTLAQTLAGLVLFAERAGKQQAEGRGDAAAATISTVEQVARDALAETRALVARSAAVPGEPAFPAAVERLVERFRAHGPEITLDVAGVEGELDRESQVVLLRCLQEALANVVRHAGAAHAGVRVRVDAAGRAEITISDDGCGFDPASRPPGFGLEGMSDRVALAGGDLDVISAPGEGTRVRVRLAGAGAVVPERDA